MTKSFVYWVYNSTCGLIEETGYVGVSVQPKRRLAEHLWADRVPANSFMSILFEGTRDECFAKELELRPEPGIGWNKAMGGKDGYKEGHSDETRAKMSAAHKGKIITKETRDRMSKSRMGRVVSKETREKISKAHKGKILSKEHREKLCEVRKGRVVSKETRAKISKAHKGKAITKEHRENIARSKIGNTYGRFPDFYCVGCKSRATPTALNREHNKCFKKKFGYTQAILN